MIDQYKIIEKTLNLTLKEALVDGGLWFDGDHLWFRQVRLGKIIIDLRRDIK